MKKVDMIVDLQYGSTGKGVIAGYLAISNGYDTVINANMPNAGHTFIDGRGNTMIHKVLPNGIVSPDCKVVMIGPGSVFDPLRLKKEMDEAAEMGYDQFQLVIHANAVILKSEHREAEKNMDNIGSTKQGSAAAMGHKLARDPDNNPTVAEHVAELQDLIGERFAVVGAQGWANLLLAADNILAEGAQGFSLGINERFYPYCTSRDCTPARFMADMSIPLTMLRKVIGTARVHPIRVGGLSGGCYPDQQETTWEALGLEVERTTVTKKVRRVFSFSEQQIVDAIRATQPDEVFLNFCNYDKDYADEVFEIIDKNLDKWGVPGSVVRYFGYGPTVNDVVDAVGAISIADA